MLQEALHTICVVNGSITTAIITISVASISSAQRLLPMWTVPKRWKQIDHTAVNVWLSSKAVWIITIWLCIAITFKYEILTQNLERAGMYKLYYGFLCCHVSAKAGWLYELWHCAKAVFLLQCTLVARLEKPAIMLNTKTECSFFTRRWDEPLKKTFV